MQIDEPENGLYLANLTAPVTAQRDRIERIKDDELSELRSELEAAVKADPDLGHALPRFPFDPYAFCETDDAAVPLDPENIRDQMRTFSCSKARASATTILDPRAEFISTSIQLAPERASGYAEQLTWKP